MKKRFQSLEKTCSIATLLFSYQIFVTACGETSTSEVSNSVNVKNFIDAKGDLDPGYEKTLRQKYASQPKMIKLIDATKALLGTPYSKMDCSKFAKTVFESAGLNFSKGKNQIATNELASGSVILDTFQRSEVNSTSILSPSPSDLLGWPAGANGANYGHVVVVIDPENCVIAHSTSWMLDRIEGKKSPVDGVAFNKIEANYCTKSETKSWWKLNNKDDSTWTFHLRQK